MTLASFDIFDTCLVRACGDSHHVFNVLAQKVLGKGALPSLFPEFVQERVKAEHEARLRTKDEDITLEQIYQQADFSALCTTPKWEIMEEEKEIERQLLMPVYEIKLQIEKARRAGARIAFISDMYLPKAFLEERLRTFGFYQEGDLIFVSSEIGLTKETGHLFDYIARQLNVDFAHWLHYGDNRIADYAVPRRRGIHATLVRHDYSEIEQFWRRNAFLQTFPCNDILAGVVRALRLQSPSSVTLDFVWTFIALLFTAWTLNILNDARQRGITKLFFLARDGYWPYRIAKQFSDLYPDIELAYLFVSRKSLYLPGYKDFSAEILRNILQSNISQTVAYALDVWNCNDEIILPAQIASEVITSTNVDQLFQQLINIGLVEKMLFLQHKTRELVMDYFVQEGVNREHVAVVDIRGTRNSHKRINDILLSHCCAPVFAYYLEVFEQRCSVRLANDYLAEIYDECIGMAMKPFLKHPDMIEQVFATTNQARTIGYRTEGNKVVPVSAMHHTQNNTLADQIEKGLGPFVECVRKVRLHLFPSEMLSLSLRSLVFFFENPSRSYVSFLSQITLSETDVDAKPYVKIYKGHDWLRICCLSKKIYNTNWLKGDLVLNLGRFSKTYYSLFILKNKLMEKCRSLLNY